MLLLLSLPPLCRCCRRRRCVIVAAAIVSSSLSSLSLLLLSPLPPWSWSSCRRCIVVVVGPWLGRPRVRRQGGSRLGERGELQRKVMNEKKKTTCTYPSSRAAEGLHAVQSSWPSLLLDHGWALEGEDGHLHQQGGSRMGECGELLSEIANEKRKIPSTRLRTQLISRSTSLSVIARQRRRCGARRRVASGL